MFVIARKAQGTVIGLTSLLALAGCDPGTVTSAPAADAETELAAMGPSEVPSQMLWEWSGGDLQGWTINIAEAVVSWPESGGLSILAPAMPDAPNLYLRSPKISIEGKRYSHVLVDLEALVPATDVDFALYYVTDLHGEDFGYRGGPLDSAPLAAGERRVLKYDMIRQVAGGTDWTDSIIRQIRLDLPEGASSNYIVHSVQLCPADAADCG